MAAKALVKYYARLVQKGYNKNNIPADVLSEVEAELVKMEEKTAKAAEEVVEAEKAKEEAEDEAADEIQEEEAVEAPVEEVEQVMEEA